MKVGFAGILLAAVVARAADLPQASPDRHLGVATCASALCHNAVAPRHGGGPRLDEYRTWRRDDAHAHAYDSLLGDAGQRIARRAGVGAPERATVCLDCHADRAAATGPRHDLADGVGCEACHGGAERWLDSHAHGGVPADDLQRGMYPTADPVRRAELCASCHVGSATKQVTHRLIAAGHPRLVFELDTFSAREPSHAEIDDDYRARKPAPSSAELWATGQGVVARERLALLAAPSMWRAPWPELAGFDCGTCHRDATEGSGERRRAPGARPGLPRLDTASLDRWLTVLERHEAGIAVALRRDADGLDRAAAAGTRERAERAARLHAAVATAVAQALPVTLNAADVDALLRRVAGCDRALPAPSYLEAEQLAMAAQALVATREPGRQVSADPRLAPLFDRTRRFWGFTPAGFLDGLRALCPPR